MIKVKLNPMGKIFENFAEYLEDCMESVYTMNGKCQFPHFDFYSAGGRKKLRKMPKQKQESAGEPSNEEPQERKVDSQVEKERSSESIVNSVKEEKAKKSSSESSAKGITQSEEEADNPSRKLAESIKQYLISNGVIPELKKIEEIVDTEGFLKDPLFYTLLLMIHYNITLDEFERLRMYHILAGILITMAKEPTFSKAISSSLASVAKNLYEKDALSRKEIEKAFDNKLNKIRWNKAVSMLRKGAEGDFGIRGTRELNLFLRLTFISTETLRIARSATPSEHRNVLEEGLKARFGEKKTSS